MTPLHREAIVGQETAECLLPKEPLEPGKRGLLTGGNCKPSRWTSSRDRRRSPPTAARGKTGSVVDLLSPPDRRPKVVKG